MAYKIGFSVLKVAVAAGWITQRPVRTYATESLCAGEQILSPKGDSTSAVPAAGGIK